MALLNCKECGKQISSAAPACPHCGAPMTSAAPTATATSKKADQRQTRIATGIFWVLVIGFFLWLYNSFSSHEERNAQEKETACASDIKCSGDKFYATAESECHPLLTARAKEIAKWDFKLGEEGLLGRMLLLSYRWAGDDKKQIIYSGDRAKFQNGFGAWKTVSYECLFDIGTQKGVAAKFDQPAS